MKEGEIVLYLRSNLAFLDFGKFIINMSKQVLDRSRRVKGHLCVGDHKGTRAANIVFAAAVKCDLANTKVLFILSN